MEDSLKISKLRALKNTAKKKKKEERLNVGSGILSMRNKQWETGNVNSSRGHL